MTGSLVLTTINVPRALTAYRKAMPDTHFFIVGDKKTPDIDVVNFLDDVSSHSYYGYDWQEKLGYECSALIGPGSIQRRNIGFLEALKSGAEWLYSCDDDNFILDMKHGQHVEDGFAFTNGVKVGGRNNRWFDPGQFLRPKSKHRGFPSQIISEPLYGVATDVKVGVVAGTCIANPDIDATTRIALAPDVQQVSLLVQAGYVVDPQTWTVFNSQATAVRREFVPAWFLWNHCGRMDDIYASFLVQRVMRDRGYHVHCGLPFALQERNDHNLVADLRAEIDGYENVVKLAAALDAIILRNRSVLDDCRAIWDMLSHIDFVPAKTVETAHAFLRDCEKVL